MNQSIVAIVLLAVMATTATAATSDADMMRCAAIPARDARLDCFDALAHQLSSKAAAPTAAQIPMTPPAPVTAPAAVQAPTSASTIPPAASQAPPAAVFADDPKNFGFTPAQQHTVDVGLQRITASISNVSSNQKGETFVLLDNGQTWSVAENDGWLATGQAVIIKRSSMRSYLMRIPSNHTYFVHRLK
jgi:hypothetical protein